MKFLGIRMLSRAAWSLPGLLIAFAFAAAASAEPPRVQARQDFASDPGWEGVKNRLQPNAPPRKRQDFGYRTSGRAGGEPGEIGGVVWRSLRPAFYAKALKPLTLEDRLSASGKLALSQATAIQGYQTGSDLFVGFFNGAEQGWRPPNFLGFRLTGSNDPDGAYVEVSYGTARWEADGAFVNASGGVQAKNVRDLEARALLRIAPDGASHAWSIAYDPKAEGGRGAMTFTFDGAVTVLPLRPEHRAHGAAFDRFGLFNCRLAGNALTAFFDDIAVNGTEERFARDPGWEGKGNRDSFDDPLGYGMQDFGYSRATAHAGGKPGEIGGRFWLVEEPELSGAFGAPTGGLTLRDRLEAGGRIAMPAFSTDSAVLFGWYNSRERGWPPRDFVGVFMETFTPVGPYLAPLYGTSTAESGRTAEGKRTKSGWDAGGPEILFSPDGRGHTWRILYDPDGSEGDGLLTVQLDGRRAALKLKPGDKAKGAVLDRFGILNGFGANGKYAEVYWDDVTYTAK